MKNEIYAVTEYINREEDGIELSSTSTYFGTKYDAIAAFAETSVVDHCMRDGRPNEVYGKMLECGIEYDDEFGHMHDNANIVAMVEISYNELYGI